MQDTLHGENWRVVQKFEHRSMYDVNEKELTTVHQDETGSDNEFGVQDDVNDVLDEPAPVHRRLNGEKTTVGGNLQVLINSREELSENSDSEGCEDDTI